MNKWVQWLESRTPADATPCLRAVVERLKGIDALGSWAPRAEHADQVWHHAVHLGFSLLFYTCLVDVDRLIDKLAGQLMKHGRFRQEDLAELDAGAILGSMGANFHWKIREDRKHRVPDFMIGWVRNIETPDLLTEEQLVASLCAVEVTSAKPKPANNELTQFASDLFRRITNLRMCRFELSISGFLTPAEIDALMCAAKEGPFGSKAELSGKWEIAIDEYIWRPGGFELRNDKYSLPSWWKGGFDVGSLISGPMRLRFAQGTIVGTDAVQNPSLIHFPFQHDRYINSIQGKAERFQGAIGGPFIILLDAANLPDFTPGLRKQLERKFPDWPQVTAVIAFRRISTYSRLLGFEAIFVNPHAKHPLPPEAASRVPAGNFGYKSWCEDLLNVSESKLAS